MHDEQINMRHPLVRLAGLMDWEQIERHFASHVTSGRGRPALAPRLAAGLLYRFAPVAAMQRKRSAMIALLVLRNNDQ